MCLILITITSLILTIARRKTLSHDKPTTVPPQNLTINTLLTTTSKQYSDSQKSNDKIVQAHSGKRMALVVPFHDRFDELLKFVPYISEFLHKQGITHFKIYVMNQVDNLRFNRGALINAGFLESVHAGQSDYIVMHDVDILPVNNNLSYAYPENGPFHIASPEYHPQYNYARYIGGILSISNEHFRLVNGFSNRYYGWGLEDDEFFTRLTSKDLRIARPTRLQTNKTNTFIHMHRRPRDKSRLFNQKEATSKRDRVTGLHDVRYSVMSISNVTIDSFPCFVYNVKLVCDTAKTPWCQNKT
ncbi:Beta-1,4-galactosyltransferase 7, partial [Fragariocoptes setiger]